MTDGQHGQERLCVRHGVEAWPDEDEADDLYTLSPIMEYGKSDAENGVPSYQLEEADSYPKLLTEEKKSGGSGMAGKADEQIRQLPDHTFLNP